MPFIKLITPVTAALARPATRNPPPLHCHHGLTSSNHEKLCHILLPSLAFSLKAQLIRSCRQFYQPKFLQRLPLFMLLCLPVVPLISNIWFLPLYMEYRSCHLLQGRGVLNFVGVLPALQPVCPGVCAPVGHSYLNASDFCVKFSFFQISGV